MLTLVLLPGMHGTGELFRDFVSALGEDVKTIVATYPKDRPLGYDALVERVHGLLPTDAPYVLLGESFSGPVAIRLAASQPQGLKGLVLCGAFASNPHPRLRPLRFLLPCLPTGPLMARAAARVMLGRQGSKKQRAAFQQALISVAPEVVRNRLQAVMDVDYTDSLKNIAVPVLYLRGRKDYVVPASAMRRVAAPLPSMRIAQFDAPHMILQALPAEAAAVVKKFIQECLSISL